MQSRGRPTSSTVPRRRPAGRPLPADERILTLEILADEPLVAAGAFDDCDRVAQPVGDFAERRSCRP